MSFLSRIVSRAFYSSPNAAMVAAKDVVESTIDNNQVAVFSQPWCSYSRRAKNLLASEFPNANVKIIELDERQDGEDIKSYLYEKTGQTSVPNIFINKKHVGGNDKLHAAFRSGELQKWLAEHRSASPSPQPE